MLYICTEWVWLTYFQSVSYAPFLYICTEFALLTVFQSVSFCNISPIHVHHTCIMYEWLTYLQSVSYALFLFMFWVCTTDLFSIFELCLISIHVLSLCNWPIFSLWVIHCPRMQQCLSHASFLGTVPYRCSRFRPTWQTAIPLYSWMLKGRILSHFWI